MGRSKKEGMEAQLRDSQEETRKLRRELDVHKRVDLVANVNYGVIRVYDRVTRRPLKNSLHGDTTLLPESYGTTFVDLPARVRITIECEIEDYDWGEDER